jgi:hypothetical protein
VRPWQFSKPKTPGFGISGSFYLTILSSRPTLPSIQDFVEPSGKNGAIEAYGAPLSHHKDRSSLSQPLERGAYALASKDRKTVIKMLVMSADEAGFDPEAYVRSPYSAGASPELLARIRATWTVLQLTFESHDAAVYPAIDLMLKIAQKLASLTEGVVADAVSQRYLLPEQVMSNPRLDPRIDAREVVSISRKSEPGGLHIFTLGLQKLDLPELEIVGVQDVDAANASRFLITLAQSALCGETISSGDRFGAPNALFEVREGGFDRKLWEGVAVLELLPPTTLTPADALNAWNEQLKRSVF